MAPMTRMLDRSIPFCPIIQRISRVTLCVRFKFSSCHSRSVVKLGRKTHAESTQQTYLKESPHRATDMQCKPPDCDWVPRGCLVSNVNLSVESIVTRPLKCVKTDRTQLYKANGHTPKCGYRWWLFPQGEPVFVRHGDFDNGHRLRHPERGLTCHPPG